VQKYRISVQEVEEYNHQQWISQLATKCNYQHTVRPDHYPLDSAEEVKNISGMLEVLRRTKPLSLANPDIYDTGDDTTNLDTIQDNSTKRIESENSEPAKENLIHSMSHLDKDALTRMAIEMDLVSRHLDTVSEFYRDPKSADQLFSSSKADALADSILRGSRGLSSRQLDLPLTTAVKDGPHFAEASKEREVEEENVLNALVSTQYMEDLRLAEVNAGIRNMLRSEECRRVLCREGRRNGRFYHYMAANGAVLSKSAIQVLCNSLL